MGGQITISDSITGWSDRCFDCKPIVPLKKGDQLAASGSRAMDRVEEVSSAAPIPDGPGADALPHYSILAMYAVPGGDTVAVLPAAIRLKTSLKAGQTIKSGGYILEALRDFKSGSRICAFMVGNAALSFERNYSGKSGAGPRPSFAAFLASDSLDERAHDIEGWRIARG
jgi:hypothetical protein